MKKVKCRILIASCLAFAVIYLCKVYVYDGYFLYRELYHSTKPGAPSSDFGATATPKKTRYVRQERSPVVHREPRRKVESRKPTQDVFEGIDKIVNKELRLIIGKQQQTTNAPKEENKQSSRLNSFSYKGRVLEKVLELFPIQKQVKPLNDSPCQRLTLGRHSHKTQNSSNTNVTCESHKPEDEECMAANKAYKMNDLVIKCNNEKPVNDLCVFREKWRLSADSATSVVCDLSPCGSNPVHVIPIDNDFGILSSMDKWLEFTTAVSLQSFLPGFVAKNSVYGLQFCFLRCLRPRHDTYIKQIFTFPPILSNATQQVNPKLVNFNIINLKSVSRAHFYRSLPKTIRQMRQITRRGKLRGATVLDFELLQSITSYSFHSIKSFMSGKTGLEFDKKQDNAGITPIFGFLKSKGYYTLLQDDSCWYDEWGSIFTGNAYQNKTPSSLLDFAQQWDYYNGIVRSSNVDDIGLSNTACDVFKQYKSTNQIDEKTVCFSGRPYGEFFLDYTSHLHTAFRDARVNRPVFAFTNLGVGDDTSGTRLKQMDDSLSQYISTWSKYQDTLTIILSDHGPKYSRHSLYSMEGRAEMYDALLFVILPKSIAEKLQYSKTRALMVNQQRLVTTKDIHDAVLSIVDPVKKGDQQGLLKELPAQRDCKDLVMKPTAYCKCDKWYGKYPDNHVPFTWMAELGLGEINNAIQHEFLSGNNDSGFGKCQRLVGHSFRKVRYRRQGDKMVVTMDIFVKPKMEIFEVQIQSPFKPRGNTRDRVEVSALRRVSTFNNYKECKDKEVPLDLCVCKTKKRSRPWQWVEITSKSDMIQLLKQSKSFKSKLSVKKLHANCLLLLLRKHSNRTEVYEIANVCADRTYNIRLAGRSKSRSITSRNLPLAKKVQPFSMHFLFSVYHLKRPYGFYVKISQRMTLNH